MAGMGKVEVQAADSSAQDQNKLVKLVKRAQNGDDKAFLTLFQQMEGMIYRTAYLYVGSREDALDVVQETAYRSFISLKKLREPKYFKTWLSKIAVNCALDEIRRRKKIINLNSALLKETDCYEEEEDVSLSMSMLELLKSLPERNKTVIILRFYHDYTLQMISDTMELPLGTVKSILYKSLKKLRVTIGEEYKHE